MKDIKKVDTNKGMTPNTAQRRPNAPKHSPAKPFAIKGTKNGKA